MTSKKTKKTQFEVTLQWILDYIGAFDAASAVQEKALQNKITKKIFQNLAFRNEVHKDYYEKFSLRKSTIEKITRRISKAVKDSIDSVIGHSITYAAEECIPRVNQGDSDYVSRNIATALNTVVGDAISESVRAFFEKKETQ